MLLTDPFSVAALPTLDLALIKLLAAIAISALAYLVLFRPLDRVKVGTFWFNQWLPFSGGEKPPDCGALIVPTFCCFIKWTCCSEVWLPVETNNLAEHLRATAFLQLE
jgi:hypothetical protein